MPSLLGWWLLCKTKQFFVDAGTLTDNPESETGKTGVPRNIKKADTELNMFFFI